MTITDHNSIPISEHDPMPPPWVRRKREKFLNTVGVDEEALMHAMQGGVPAEVAQFAPPKSRVVDAGEFSTAMETLKDAIAAEAIRTAKALRAQADALEVSAHEQCAAIDMAVTDANIRQAAARQMAEAFAVVSQNITGQVKMVLAGKADPVEIRDGAEAALARAQEEREERRDP